MKVAFQRGQIAGVLTVFPAQISRFDDEIDNYAFPRESSAKLKRTMGYDQHRVAPPDTCLSDLALFGLRHMAQQGWLAVEEIGALIVVTQSPDYLLPPTSSVLHGEMGFARDTLCLDINQGCAGFVIGLVQAFLLVELTRPRKVLLVNGDVLSHRVSRRDRNSYPLVGDAAALTLIEPSDGGAHWSGEILADGTRRDALRIPAGGFRTPTTAATAEEKDDGSGNFRSLEQLVMSGGDVFNFVMNDVPALMQRVLAEHPVASEEVDWFVCHQPNRFMLEKLADKLKVPRAKVPAGLVERFGNSSGATIPAVLCTQLASELTQRPHKVCLSGFGVGLTWGALVGTLPPLRFCSFIDHPGQQRNKLP